MDEESAELRLFRLLLPLLARLDDFEEEGTGELRAELVRDMLLTALSEEYASLIVRL